MAHSSSVQTFLSELVRSLNEEFITKLIQDKHIRLLGTSSKHPGCLAVSISNLCECIPQSQPQSQPIPLLDPKHANQIAETLNAHANSPWYKCKEKMTLVRGQKACLIYHWHQGALQADKVHHLLTFDLEKKRVRLTLHVCSSMPTACHL